MCIIPEYKMQQRQSRQCAKLVVLFFACLVNVASPYGQFYVGFLGFANLQNLNYAGECCDGQLTEAGCLDFCDLIFEVSVKGIDSDPSNGKRPSEHPIDNDNAILFPTSYEGVINPITFDFLRWTGHVNITVDVYDIDDNDATSPELVDKFHFGFGHDEPSLDFIYMEQTGQRASNPSLLRMVFRYACYPSYYGQNCSIGCRDYPNNEECPDTSFNHPGVTDWISTTTTRGTTDRRCGFTRKPQSSGSGNDSGSPSNPCGNSTTVTTERTTTGVRESTTLQGEAIGKMSSTADTTIIHQSETTVSSTPSTTALTLSTTEGTSSNGHYPLSNITTNVPILDTSKTTSPTLVQNTDISTSEYLEITLKPDNNIIHGVDSSTGSPIQVLLSTTSTDNGLQTHKADGFYQGAFTTSTHIGIQSSTESQTNNTGQSKNSSDTNEADIRHVTPLIEPTMALETTTSSGLNPTMSHDPMDYWPAIVGGVLGALVLVAIITFTLYYRKQKAQLKRQDIYNVNPKRWALHPPLENGTTAKSDVALETEQV
ncbi:uncharacterized protein LOC117334980 [Pecten maximus]|uniref:uncharacterized protein LOC117334980 n=1 Tax=Pecten maximus TaxID=6579 RepID=UPI001458765B|nr:uncharacterized protein LOC117334980 [Pecten maximus]